MRESSISNSVINKYTESDDRTLIKDLTWDPWGCHGAPANRAFVRDVFFYFKHTKKKLSKFVILQSSSFAFVLKQNKKFVSALVVQPETDNVSRNAESLICARE